jgi:SET domain-containing protein
VLVALRRILPGEEITYDYGKEYFAAFITKAGCRCVRCRARRAAKRREARKKAATRARTRSSS